MEINPITIQTSLVDNTSAPVKSGVLSDRPRSGASAAGIQKAQVSTNLASASYIKNQLDEIMNSFPPFFPAGSPQRLELIKGINGVQEEIQKASLQPELKKKLTSEKLTDQPTDAEIAAALKDIKQYKDEITAKSPEVVFDSSKLVGPGTMVSIKV